MQDTHGSGSEGGPSNHQNGQYYSLPTALYPVPGSRPAGVPSNTQQAGVAPHGLTQGDIESQQRTANTAVPEVGNSREYQAGYYPMSGDDKWSWANIAENKSVQGIRNGESSLMGNQQQQTQQQQQQQQQQQPQQQTPQAQTQAQLPLNVNSLDSISAFLAEMPTQREDPTRHVLWTELIRLKTRTLELQIAEARKKEKEAELEIMRLRAGAAAKSDPSEVQTNQNNSQNDNTNGSGGMNTVNQSVAGPSNTNGLPQYSMIGQNLQPPSSTSSSSVTTIPGNTQHLYNPGSMQPAMSPFDLEAMLSTENMDNFLSWLPDLGEGDYPAPEVLSLAPSTDYNPNSQQYPVDPSIQSQMGSYPFPITSTPMSTASMTLNQTSPRRRSPSTEEHSPQQPPTKKSRRGAEKKIVIEQTSSCTTCHKSLARIMFRSPKSSMPDPIIVELKCTDCKPISQPSTLPDSSGSSTSPIGTVETRKRMRASMEFDDEEAKVRERRQWCDVCQRILGSGQITGGREKESIGGIAEIVCMECDGKYQRCTDCGGGGGPRVGIGKWRMKQVFHPGRKTCSLNHTRLGDRTREIGVHVTPTDFTPEQLKEVLTRCKALWNEKTLARLAVPEMLEVDLPPGLANPLRDFGDVDDMVTRNWPSREAMIKANGLDPNRFKRLLSLIWSHSKPRRSVRTVDLEEGWSRPEDNDDDLSTVLAHVKKTNVVIPPGSELIGMWGSEWDTQNGSLLISTFIPFEGADGEDSTALSVGEMITKVQSLRQEINADRLSEARGKGEEPDLLPPVEHLWTVSGGYIPLVRERFADILIRKRSFVHVEEYLTRHPEFIKSIQARPVGLHPDIHRPIPTSETDTESQQHAKPVILVRWLGKEFDAAKILEIKQMEFGGKKKKSKK
ncbi:uncharacterized protein IL334_006277 [Kwoniella shivajii]|uniref:Stc1 domain-containing protein n=1 Tax=Kwoniella shivajii TaxID=564305 RepID=A0ABZ1D5H5_9TREE|nr:hypothetical protein IL334_006277 [Kwoniella shivajii]